MKETKMKKIVALELLFAMATNLDAAPLLFFDRILIHLTRFKHTSILLCC